MRMLVKTFTDTLTGTFSYVVYRKDQKVCAVIDLVLGYNFRSGKTDTKGADDILAFVVDQGIEVQWLLETHMHADHLSSSAYLRKGRRKNSRKREGENRAGSVWKDLQL